MKKILICLIWTAAVILLPSVLIDPYNVFHADSIKNNRIEPNKNYIKTRFIIKNPGRYDSLMFGSSRVSMIHVEKAPERCYNMAYSEGLPKEHLDNLKAIIRSGARIDKVYMGVDDISFEVDPESHLHYPMRVPYPLTAKDTFSFLINYLDPKKAVESLNVTYGGESTVTLDREIYSTGVSIPYGSVSAYDWENAIPYDQPYYFPRTEEALCEIKELKDFCDSNGIELVVFTNPMHRLTFEKAVESGYTDFLKGLAEITDFYNFSGYNDITLDDGNYLETSHIKPEVADLMIDALFYKKFDKKLLAEGFGALVTKDNVGSFVEIFNKEP